MPHRHAKMLTFDMPPKRRDGPGTKNSWQMIGLQWNRQLGKPYQCPHEVDSAWTGSEYVRSGVRRTCAKRYSATSPTLGCDSTACVVAWAGTAAAGGAGMFNRT